MEQDGQGAGPESAVSCTDKNINKIKYLYNILDFRGGVAAAIAKLLDIL